ncbi:interferon kappa [Myotis daubentonii]|uniref:interferon kappa n=1 Tax=Myotis daubentonii TaxID=98922 RepID=UPI0028736A78|nr:interferon kappa [Myotis daubentonii]
MNTQPDVIRKCVWPACLTGLFITGTLSLGCDLLHIHLRRVTWQNVKLLTNMSKPFPLECLRENKAFQLPREVLAHSQPLLHRDIQGAFYEMSMLAFNIFAQPTFQSTGEEKHREQIQTGLDQQLQYLEQCSQEEKGKKDKEEMEEEEKRHSGARTPQPSNLELRRYFHRISSFLKDKQYSHCAWKIVQVEIRRCFYYFQTLIELLRRK